MKIKGYKLVFCHGIPERCFKFGTVRMPICARCFGIIVGAQYTPFVVLYLILARNFSWFYILLFSFLMTLPMLYDGFTQYFGDRMSNNRLRFVTGIFFGIGASSITTILSMQFVGLIFGIDSFKIISF